MVVAKWSACLSSILMIQVRISLKSTVFSMKCVFEKNDNKQKQEWPIILKRNDA